MNNSSTQFQGLSDSTILGGKFLLIVLTILFVFFLLKRMLIKHKVKEANTLSIFGILIIVLISLTFYYTWQNNSGMATATTTMVLVIITGFYTWNTHLQVKSMTEQADLIRDQISVTANQSRTMEEQFTLMLKNIKRDRITKEMNLLILPLKTIYKEIESKGIEGDWWTYYLPLSNPTNSMAVERFRNAVDVVDQHKYLASKELYPLIDTFIQQLKYIKKDSDWMCKDVLQNATRALFESKKENEMFRLIGGMVEERYNEITINMRILDEDLLKKEKVIIQRPLTDFIPKKEDTTGGESKEVFLNGIL